MGEPVPAGSRREVWWNVLTERGALVGRPWHLPAAAQEATMAMSALKSGDVGGAEKTLMGTMLHLGQGKK